ncbi:ribonuclease P protein component [Rubritalea sp.]|uniref:ribonuclease P protein component n=1 Tax=Rubritalea sp. TaxID=2109375 RepID=UPI003EFABF5A
MRLPRKFSMNHRAEFARVRELGESRPGRYLVVSTLPAAELEHFKLGLITTKKVGKAHQRNYLRRVFRSIIQKHGESLREDCYIVTIARWRATEASYEELEREWLKLTRKLGLFTSVE